MTASTQLTGWMKITNGKADVEMKDVFIDHKTPYGEIECGQGGVQFQEGGLPSPSARDTEIRIRELRDGRWQWGCDGFTRLKVGECLGSKLTSCWIKNSTLEIRPGDEGIYVKTPGSIHFHDLFCAEPRPLELALAGVTVPKRGWRSRA